MIQIIDCHTHAGTDYFWQQAGFNPSFQSLSDLLQKVTKEMVAGAVVFPMASPPYYAYEGLLRG